MKSQLLILLRILCMQWITPPWWSQILPLFLSFNNLFTMCLGGSLSLFYWSWLIVFDVQIVFHEIWGVLAIMSSLILSFLSSPSVTPIACMFVCLMVYHGFLLIFIHSFCFLFLILEIWIDLFFCSLILSLTTSNLLLNSSSEFSFQLLYFSTTGFLFGSF